jgi:hypothetical protein
MGTLCALCCPCGIDVHVWTTMNALEAEGGKLGTWRCAVHMQLQGETRDRQLVGMCVSLSGVDWNE